MDKFAHKLGKSAVETQMGTSAEGTSKVTGGSNVTFTNPVPFKMKTFEEDKPPGTPEWTRARARGIIEGNKNNPLFHNRFAGSFGSFGSNTKPVKPFSNGLPNIFGTTYSY